LTKPALNICVAQLVARLRSGHRRTLARIITEVETSSARCAEILAAIQPHLGHAHVIGLTGAPGVGKSTLINALIKELRAHGQTVAVVAVDPSSPMSGGAILGDRIRMAEHVADAKVFVRSVASRAQLGGLSPTTARIIDVLDAAGWDTVLVETVGTGQSEIDIAALAQTRIVVCAPGFGDEIQAMKAGVLEIADIVVVNKADLPFADATAQQIASMMALRAPCAAAIPVFTTVARSDENVAALNEELRRRAHATRRERSALDRIQRLIAHTASVKLRDEITANQTREIERLCQRVQRGELNVEAAALEWLKRYVPPDQDPRC